MNHVWFLGQEEAEAGRKRPERFLEDLVFRLLRKGGAEKSWVSREQQVLNTFCNGEEPGV